MRLIASTVAILLFGSVSFLLRLGYTPDPRVMASRDVDLSVDYSNILPSDYVGSDSCAECHADQHQDWLTHPHSRMNQLPNEQTVRADFANATLKLPDATATFSNNDGKYFMTIRKHDEVFREYEVTRTVGSRYMQYFIGKQMAGPDAPDHAVYQEHMLPFAYWFALKRWFPRRYFDADGDEQLVNGTPCVEAVNADPAVRPYTANCMNCHNTLPYVYRIYHDKLAGFPKATVSAAIKPLGLSIGEDPRQIDTPQQFSELNAGLDPNEDLITLGISCESCHFGGREHVQHQRAMRYLPTSPFAKVKSNDPKFPLASDGSTAATINGICSQCHSGGGLRFPEGALKSNSAEGHDFQKGFCATQMSCVDCHSPHAGSSSESGFGNDALYAESCLKCHTQFQDETVSLRHSGHAAEAGVSCLDCHMPRYNQGVNGLSRTHRICMPVEKQKMETTGANACNLCHADKSFDWTVNELKRGWGVKLDVSPEKTMAKRWKEPAVDVWRNGDDNHMRFVAVQCLSREPATDVRLKKMISSLNDPEPLNRAHAENAIRRSLALPADQRIPVDVLDAPARRRAQIAAWLRNIGP